MGGLESIQEILLYYFIVKEANEGRMAGLSKIEESKYNKPLKLKEDQWSLKAIIFHFNQEKFQVREARWPAED